jgi:hypothetical protein
MTVSGLCGLHRDSTWLACRSRNALTYVNGPTLLCVLVIASGIGGFLLFLNQLNIVAFNYHQSFRTPSRRSLGDSQCGTVTFDRADRLVFFAPIGTKPYTRRVHYPPHTCEQGFGGRQRHPYRFPIRGGIRGVRSESITPEPKISIILRLRGCGYPLPVQEFLCRSRTSVAGPGLPLPVQD